MSSNTYSPPCDLPESLRALQQAPPPVLFLKGRGASACAKAFATALLDGKDSSPDLRELRPEGRGHVHTMDSVRELIREVAIFPYEKGWKVFIIHEAERLPIEASNALLKTLEEPASYVRVILAGTSEGVLPETLLSRSLLFVLSEGRVRRTDDEETLSLIAQLWTASATGEYALFFRLLAEIDVERGEEEDRLLESAYGWYGDRYLMQIEGKGDGRFVLPPDGLERVAENMDRARRARLYGFGIRRALSLLML
ncbi:MAG: hypothetical protein OXF02_05045 [Simkaniaceae bacterium]|nr:hypothetical protein [Simkaniaceae bacterium]